ncbi:lipopolysaccharide heptosyltransferase II [bacterium]|nr:lipopolysaccharide heptosyltransferase II [bacterium]
MRILLVQTAFIGDCVLTTPLIRRTREAFGDEAVIVVLTTPDGKDVFDGNPNIDEIMVYDKRNSDTKLSTHFGIVNDLITRHFDIAILPHRSFRTGLITFMSRISERIGFSKSGGSFFYTKKVEKPKDMPEPERLLELLTVLGHDPKPHKLEIFPGEERKKKANTILKKFGLIEKPFITVAPGSVWGTKRYPPDLYAEVIKGILDEKIAEGVVLLGGPKDIGLCEKIVDKAGDMAFSAAGETDILTSATIIAQSKAFIGNDSGPAHIAAAAGTAVISIFGPTVPEFGFVPYGENVTILEPPIELSCRPCGTHGKMECSRGDHGCMVSIFPDRVVSAVAKAVAK